MSLTPAFHGELMLLSWRETHNGGASVTFQLADADDLHAFKRMTLKKGKVAGQRLAAVLVEIGDDEQPKTAERVPPVDPSTTAASIETVIGPGPNEIARKLHVNGAFRNPRLWLALDERGIYTQYEHGRRVLEAGCWAPIPSGPHHGDVVLHHCKSPSTVGSDPEYPQKPPKFYGVGLCYEHHVKWAHGSATREQKQVLLEHAISFTAEQVKAAIKRYLDIPSLRDIDQGHLDRLAMDLEIRLL